MLGQTHDTPSYALDDIIGHLEDAQNSLQSVLENMVLYQKASLIPIVDQYESDITRFLTDLKVHTVSDGRAVIHTYEADEMVIFLEKLLKGAKEVL